MLLLCMCICAMCYVLYIYIYIYIYIYTHIYIYIYIYIYDCRCTHKMKRNLFYCKSLLCHRMDSKHQSWECLKIKEPFLSNLCSVCSRANLWKWKINFRKWILLFNYLTWAYLECWPLQWTNLKALLDSFYKIGAQMIMLIKKIKLKKHMMIKRWCNDIFKPVKNLHLFVKCYFMQY